MLKLGYFNNHLRKYLRWEYVFIVLIFLFGVGIRFYHLTSVPLGLYIDEVSIGYNANQILHTGKDEYGQPYPMAFRAFGEYKLPVYIYLTSGSIFLFGKTDFAVRFPSFFFGSLSIAVFYFLIKQLVLFDTKFIPKKRSTVFVVLSTFLFMILPWNVMFSRIGYEVNVALFFYLAACLFFLKTLSDKKVWSIILCFGSLVITIYTYDSFRLISPLTLIVFSIYLYKELFIRRQVIILFILAILTSFPMLLFTFSPDGSVRLSQTSAFSPYASLPLYEKIITYPVVYLQNYLSYFSPSYFFSLGDGLDRDRIIGFGPLFRLELPLLLLGLYYVFVEYKGFSKWFILFLLLVTPTAGAFTTPSPHQLRSMTFVIPLIIIISFALTQLVYTKVKIIKYILPLFIIAFVFNICSYYYNYFGPYPYDSIISWGGGFQNVVLDAAKLQPRYRYIVLNELLGNDYAYFKFYNPNLNYIETKKDKLWEKPRGQQNAKVLYITGNPKDPELKYVKHIFIENVYLPNLNHDVFATFYQL